jgi:nitrite reductase (NADH) small subunit
MAFVRVASVSSLPPGSVTEVTVGEAPYAVCNVGGELHALSGTCPHAGGPLGEGNVQDNLVICPWHGWAYDCRSGENDYDPTIKLDCFAVKAQGDDILIDPETRA